ncbi:MAG TPA: imidazole glycerol phosphate synthase subunit HisF [Rectinemataceae bacterium]|nr:imidazole glycerol phosphate synthase subunit HisF [Rectinemataceae bacterium]
MIGTSRSEIPTVKSPTECIPARGTATRIIPCLDIKGGRVVKGVKFENLVDSGEPAELARRYEEEGADEIALLDISATLEERRTALEAVAAVRAAVSIPISVGGGIRSVEDAERLLNAGADRVSVNSAAVRHPELIARLAERFGVQCVIVAIDAKRGNISQTHGENTLAVAPERWEVFIDAGKTPTGLDAVEWARRCAALGAGEILLTSIDRDGTGLGYDCELVSAIAAAARIPVVASGGATRPEHFLAGVLAGASAVLGAGAFHRRELAIMDLKNYLSNNGVEVRI